VQLAVYQRPLDGQPFWPSASHSRVTEPSDALMMRNLLVVFGCVTSIVYASTVLPVSVRFAPAATPEFSAGSIARSLVTSAVA
jgi:hypothetical protein